MTIADVSFLLEQKSASLYGSDRKLIESHWTPKPGQTCMDIGFGPGTWTLAALARGARVFAFDPRIEAVELLTRQALLNNFVGCCILPFALQDRSGRALFSESSFHWGELNRTVGTCSLDEFLAGLTLGSLDFINMDAEGSELEILKGAAATLRRYRPKLIVEVHQNVDKQQIVALIESVQVGYQIRWEGSFLIAEVPPA